MSEQTVSVVVPVFNEADNVEPLVHAVRSALGAGDSWELVFVDDGSSDATADVVATHAVKDPRIRLIRLARNYGQTPAMQAGFDHARGEVIVSMDGDLQNDPGDIPRLLEKIEEGFDLVVGYRLRRKDRLISRKIPSWCANRLIRWITGVKIRDNGCSLKAYRRELLRRMHLYSDMHRFIPAVAAATAGARIAEIPVRHHARRFGKSKYGISRVLKVLADLLTIKMIRSFRERPLLMFVVGAMIAAAISGAFFLAAIVSLVGFHPDKANAIVLPGAALLWLGLGGYLLLLGLIAQMVLADGYGGSADLAPLVRERRHDG
jgi:glycosyltransferase involved in cell wall biosynthesis